MYLNWTESELKEFLSNQTDITHSELVNSWNQLIANQKTALTFLFLFFLIYYLLKYCFKGLDIYVQHQCSDESDDHTG